VLLQNKVAIVSGVGAGVGRAVALAFAREGADVALAGRTEHFLVEVAAEVESLGRRALCIATDVTEPAQCERLAEATDAAFGGIDVLVNNAFVSTPHAPLMDSDLDDWRRPMEVNYWGSLNVTHAVVPYMRRRGGGHVVMTSTPYRHPREAFGAYISSKGALRAACRVLALELAAFDITVNTVGIGSADGANLQKRFEAEGARRGIDPREVRREWEVAIPLRRIPSPDEIANAVLFFSSHLASAVTAQFLLVDGGQFIE
jgi:NAD(P)-dependent dehydrogenase (short-subunit alcohol dehydrogenase family)